MTDRENIVARAEELGCDLRDGGSVVIARARPLQPEEGDWRARVLTVAERGARAVERGALAALIEVAQPSSNGHEKELVIVVPADLGPRAADAVLRELEAGLDNYTFTVALSRPAGDPVDLHRAGAEALLAANVAEARGESRLSFEETGAYRLLLPAMSEDPTELRRFHDETVAPLVAYDEQYDRARPHARVVPGRRRQRRQDRREALHPSPHDPLPARPRARADGTGRRLYRRPRAALAGPQGNARSRHRAARRSRPRARRRGGSGAKGGEGPLGGRGAERVLPTGGEGFAPPFPGPKPGVLLARRPPKGRAQDRRPAAAGSSPPVR